MGNAESNFKKYKEETRNSNLRARESLRREYENTFEWDSKSAGRKIIGKYDPKKDSLRNCKNCRKHINHHKPAHMQIKMGGPKQITSTMPRWKCPEKQRKIPGIEGVITDRGFVTPKGTIGR